MTSQDAVSDSFAYDAPPTDSAPIHATPTAELADEALFALLKSYCAEADGRIRAEHVMSAAGAILGELVLAQVHPEVLADESYLKSGQVFISDPVNVVLSDNATDPAEIGPASIWGLTREILQRMEVAHIMPDCAGLYEAFAAGQPQRFGFVPLTVPEESQVWMMPLRTAFELRGPVSEIFKAHDLTEAEARAACILCAMRLVAATLRVLDPALAVRIFLETVWGMAKTVPMTHAALADLNAMREMT